jgi:succinate-acetate transporter protein
MNAALVTLFVSLTLLFFLIAASIDPARETLATVAGAWRGLPTLLGSTRFKSSVFFLPNIRLWSSTSARLVGAK